MVTLWILNFLCAINLITVQVITSLLIIFICRLSHCYTCRDTDWDYCVTIWVIQGDSGAKGDRGLPGTVGMPGSTGQQGSPGSPGEQGKPGQQVCVLEYFSLKFDHNSCTGIFIFQYSMVYHLATAMYFVKNHFGIHVWASQTKDVHIVLLLESLCLRIYCRNVNCNSILF